MSGSGLVYAAVLAAWGAYFVSRSMRSGAREVAIAPEGTVLRRRGAVDLARGAYSVLRPPAEQPALPQVKPRQIAVSADPAPAPYRISRATARRRRRTLFLLVSALVGLEVASLAGALPGWTPGLPGLLLLTFLVELRVQARRAAAPMLEVPFEAESSAGRRGRAKKTGPEFWDPWPSFDPAELPKGALADLAKGWAPRPVPLPTYVTAAKAEPVPGTRRIDIAAGRPWMAPTETDVDADADTRPMPFKPGDVVAETPIADQVEADFELKIAVNE
ncbi:MAG TPA: hypothetical protein VE081_01960 [Sporichthyaceae bacterium]|nr:hypothetical protein [Sporichthyaceae bacterium]